MNTPSTFNGSNTTAALRTRIRDVRSRARRHHDMPAQLYPPVHQGRPLPRRVVEEAWRVRPARPVRPRGVRRLRRRRAGDHRAQQALALAGVPTLFLIVTGLARVPIVRHGTPEQIRKFVTPTCNGETKCALPSPGECRHQQLRDVDSGHTQRSRRLDTERPEGIHLRRARRRPCWWWHAPPRRAR